MDSNSILVVDDELSYLELVKGLLNQEGYENVITEDNPLNVIALLDSQQVDLIMLDVYMPQMNGLDLLEKIYAAHPKIPVIVITAVDERKVALKAIDLGAYEFITKPPDTDRLLLTIRRALGNKLLETERDTLRKGLTEEEPEKKIFSDIITDSPLLFKVFELVEIFAPTDEIILLTGETGTGKDLLAKKIHDLSPRRNGPFIAVNLASISSTLFESELFGHKKGTFTGAGDDKIGYFEAARGGTIFLDEIGELPLELQGKLLRTIQYNEIMRIGDPKPISLDMRVISATNRNLLDDVNNKKFRADLYYRINRGYINIPPLRKRGDDMLILANHFLEAGNKTYDRNILGFSEEVIAELRSYHFPGNIRELENIIINAVATTSNNEYIDSIDLPQALHNNNEKESETGRLTALENVIVEHINYVMKKMGNNVQKAAPILGVSERTLQRRLKTIRDNRTQDL